MARQRSGSNSARNSRGPRGAKPASTRPARSGATRPATDAAEVEAAEVEAAEVETAEVETAEVEAAEVEAPEVEAPEPAAPPVLGKKKPVAAEPIEAEVETEADDEAEVDAAEADDDEGSASAAELWSEVRIAPVEIALPKGAGYTLRAYRMSDQLVPTEIADREDEFAAYRAATADNDDDLDDIDLGIELETTDADVEAFDEDDESDDESEDDEDADADDIDAELDSDDETDSDADDESDDDDESEESDDDDASDDEEKDVDVKAEAEEVPIFLGRAGQLYLFSTPEGLVEFIRTSDDHDLAQLDTWADLRERVTVADIAPESEDRYELDLVVENLRGGAETLDLPLLIQAGEAARDLGYALRLDAVITALSPGSPLDDIDEAIRTADNGGLRGFLARRKLRKIVTEQTALGWRTIIGKISGVVDWRN